ncbi:MAG: DUF2207 domain-containing protein [Coriobacteriaceae bacterium]|nr:DUF2207 domain-containing protein [Coriobacteriaceae bacterium]
MPSVSWASAFELPRVHVQAQVMDNGDLFVTEARTFEFTDDVNGVFWDIPLAQNEQGTASQVTVLSVYTHAGAVENEAEARRSAQPIQEVPSAESGASGVYTVQPDEDSVTLKVFMPSADGDEATVWVSYLIEGAVMAWQDAAELYWQFIGSEWEEDAQDVRLDLGFVLPEGAPAATAGSDDANFRAWGHGPLDGEVALDVEEPLDPKVTLTAPTVEAGQFAEVRVAFPVDWVPGLAPAGDARLDTILSEEMAWAEQANAQRERARTIATAGTAALTAGPAILLAATALWRKKHYVSPKPVVDETYFRDLPSNDHPAVLSALMNAEEVSDRAFVATLMKLTDDRVIEIVHTSRTEDRFLGLGEKTVEEYEIRLVAREKVTNEIDRLALEIYFGADASNGDTVRFDALKDREDVGEALDNFKAEVSAELERRGLTNRVPMGFKVTVGAFGIALGVLAVGFIIYTDGVNLPFVLAGIAMSVAAAALAATAKLHSQEAVELIDRCDALKKWLEDFTNLDEAVPGDLILWNKMLVLAVAFGVSDEVLRQLADAVPEDRRIDANGGYYFPSYWWFYRHGGMHSPMHEMHDAYQATIAELASSSSSSGSGFGGGFSGGGGGGVGGGGGGSF